MRAEGYAVLTALCWGLGAFLEKRGVKVGQLSPVTGTLIRTAVSLLFLLIISFPLWGQVKSAGVRSISLIAVGGGVMAGGLGIMFLYTALKAGSLSTVTAIAFCLTPVIGAALGIIALREKLAWQQGAGIALCIAGAALVIYFKGD
jgi:uncharacterized membrane protein